MSNHQQHQLPCDLRRHRRHRGRRLRPSTSSSTSPVSSSYLRLSFAVALVAVSTMMVILMMPSLSSSPIKESSFKLFVLGEEADGGGVATMAQTDNVEGTSSTEETDVAGNAEEVEIEEEEPLQSGPLVDLLGPKLYSLTMVNEQQVQVNEHYTTDALRKKDVIGLYFSADWCGPCRQFTPELVKFYDKMNKKTRGSFEIVWISRCRDTNSYVNYFSHMPWLAIPPEEALGERGEYLGKKYGVKGIPSLVLLDDLGSTITTDARNKIPQDLQGIGFPWRNPVSQMYSMILPRSLRMLIKLQIDSVRKRIVHQAKSLVGLGGGHGQRKQQQAGTTS
mmetsp:Transcript_61362/g.150192  ORF Transcript_61362/g.150192 Transcript_61362/m.150192 type:complete len:335 (-) Transcript_61362:79-1083(-)